MKKVAFIFLFLHAVLQLEAQQTTHYTQFMLNEYGSNPAVGGAINSGINFLIGRRSQWVGFDYAPETNFASAFFTLGKKGYKYYWHGVGAYIEYNMLKANSLLPET